MLISLTAASHTGTLCAFLRQALGKRSSRRFPVHRDVRGAKPGACRVNFSGIVRGALPHVPDHSMGPMSKKLGAMLQGAHADEDKTSCAGQALASHSQKHRFTIQ